MTNHNLYLGERPEYTTPWLNNSATFTDTERGWNYLFMAGQPNNSINNNATRQRITRQF